MPSLILPGSLLSMSGQLGEDVSLGKCVLLSTSKAVERAVKLWDVSGDGGFWKVQLDVRDLGGHLDFTRRAHTGTLSKRVGEATVGVAAVGALRLGFHVKLGLVRGGLHPVSPPWPLVLSGLPLCVQFGLLKCFPTHLLSFISLMGLLRFILLFILFTGSTA